MNEFRRSTRLWMLSAFGVVTVIVAVSSSGPFVGSKAFAQTSVQCTALGANPIDRPTDMPTPAQDHPTLTTETTATVPQIVFDLCRAGRVLPLPLPLSFGYAGAPYDQPMESVMRLRTIQREIHLLKVCPAAYASPQLGKTVQPDLAGCGPYLSGTRIVSLAASAVPNDICPQVTWGRGAGTHPPIGRCEAQALLFTAADDVYKTAPGLTSTFSTSKDETAWEALEGRVAVAVYEAELAFCRVPLARPSSGNGDFARDRYVGCFR